MKTFDYADTSPISKVEFRQGMSGQEAVIEINLQNAGRFKQLSNLPDAFRKQDGVTAEGVSGSNPPKLKVRGFGSESQVLDTISAEKLGSPVAERGEGKFASAVSASRQTSGERTR